MGNARQDQDQSEPRPRVQIEGREALLYGHAMCLSTLRPPRDNRADVSDHGLLEQVHQREGLETNGRNSGG